MQVLFVDDLGGSTVVRIRDDQGAGERTEHPLDRPTPGPLVGADLGEVLARFTRRGEELKIDLVARTPEAAEALRRELPQLSAALSRDDAKAQVSVHVGGDDARQQAGQQSTFSAQSDERRGGARHDARPTAALPFSGADDDPAPEAARVLAAPASALGRLDALA